MLLLLVLLLYLYLLDNLQMAITVVTIVVTILQFYLPIIVVVIIWIVLVVCYAVGYGVVQVADEHVVVAVDHKTIHPALFIGVVLVVGDLVPIRVKPTPTHPIRPHAYYLVIYIVPSQIVHQYLLYPIPTIATVVYLFYLCLTPNVLSVSHVYYLLYCYILFFQCPLLLPLFCIAHILFVQLYFLFPVFIYYPLYYLIQRFAFYQSTTTDKMTAIWAVCFKQQSLVQAAQAEIMATDCCHWLYEELQADRAQQIAGFVLAALLSTQIRTYSYVLYYLSLFSLCYSSCLFLPLILFNISVLPSIFACSSIFLFYTLFFISAYSIFSYLSWSMRLCLGLHNLILSHIQLIYVVGYPIQSGTPA